MPGDSSLRPFDQEIVGSVRIIVSDIPIEFQFPPRIKADSKASIWKSFDVASFEPVKWYWGSEARKLGLSWEYISTSNIFTPKKIKKIIGEIKRYFYEAHAVRNAGKYPVVEIAKLYNLIEGPAQFRLHELNMEYSDELFRGEGGVWPIHTTVTMQLELATKIIGKGAVSGAGGVGAKIDATNLSTKDGGFPQIEWW